MTFRTIAVVFLALFCGVSLAFALFRSNLRNQSAEDGTVNTEVVVVAARPLSRFQEITELDLALRSCSKEWVAENSVTNIEEATGQLASANLFEGDVITQDKLREKGPGNGVALIVKPGMRAYTIQTSRLASNVAGFIMPGNKVDVLLNLKGSLGDATGGGSTTTLLQAIEVLAVAQLLEAPDDFKVEPNEMTSVTLHVTPQQVNDLDLGQNMGVLTLSLRNPEDDVDVETYPSTVADVRFLGGQANNGLPEGMVDEPLPPAPVAAPPKKEAPVFVITLRGRHRGKLLLSDG